MAWRREKASCRINKPVAWSTGSSNVGAIRARRQQTKMKQVPNENETIAPRACKTAVRAKRKCRRRAKLLSTRATQGEQCHAADTLRQTVRFQPRAVEKSHEKFRGTWRYVRHGAATASRRTVRRIIYIPALTVSLIIELFGRRFLLLISHTVRRIIYYFITVKFKRSNNPGLV